MGHVHVHVCVCASHRVIFAGLELEVVCFVEHRVLLHEELLVELLNDLRGRQEGRFIQGRNLLCPVVGQW